MKLEITDEAEAEIQKQFDWYANLDRRVAEKLADLFESAIVSIVRSPYRYPLMEMRRNPGNVRRVRLKGFPICVLYEIGADEIRVFAAIHTSRRPGYWRSRLSE
jgi:plasmid stabilization system protein ParE